MMARFAHQISAFQMFLRNYRGRRLDGA